MKSSTGVNSTFSIFSAALQVSDFSSSLFKLVCERVPGYLSSSNLSIYRMGSSSYVLGFPSQVRYRPFTSALLILPIASTSRSALGFKKTATTSGNKLITDDEYFINSAPHVRHPARQHITTYGGPCAEPNDTPQKLSFFIMQPGVRSLPLTSAAKTNFKTRHDLKSIIYH